MRKCRFNDRNGRRRRVTTSCQATSVDELENRILFSLAGNQLFPADNPWNHPITDAPVAANSATLVNSIGAGSPLHPDFGTIYGIPYNVVTGTQAKVNVTIDAYPSESDLLPVPIPANAVIEGDPPAGVAAFSNVPSFVQVSLTNQGAYTWAPQTSDSRALQDPTTPGSNFASTWYSYGNFTVDLNFTDGQAHRVAFYMLDWENAGRTQTVDVLDPATSKLLNEQPVSNFSGGEYLIFDFTGHVQLKFTNTNTNSSANAVLSGIFFGAPGSPAIGAGTAAQAAFVKADTTTQGNWQGVYGGSGFDMAFPQGQGDRHLIVYDSTNNIAYELFYTHRPSEEPDGQWHADSEAVWNMSQDSFRPPGWTSADAAGLPILPGLVRPDETLTQGVINHALRFTVPRSDSAYVFPASHQAGVNNAALPRMGERFRLNPSFNISGFPAADQVILQALKTYGMIVADNGSSWFITGSPSAQWNDDELHSLTQVIGSNFQVVNLTPVLSSLSQSSGGANGGNTVTITGVNFQGVAGQLQVNFGTVAATNVQVTSDNTLTATVPSQAVGTKVDVTITTPYGTSAVSTADQYTYTASLPPGVTASPGAVYIYNAASNALSLTSGTLTFNGVGSPSSMTLDVTADGAASTLAFNTTTYLNSLTLTNAAHAQLALSGADTVTGTGASAALVSYGTTLAQANTKALVLNGLSIPAAGAVLPAGGTNGAQGTLDLTDNAMVLNYTGTPQTAINNANVLMLPASDFGSWDGTGVTSSEAQADAHTNGATAVGVAENSTTLDLSTFAGQTLAANHLQMLFMFTYNGDATLDGKISSPDVQQYISGLSTNPGGPAGTSWGYGEFDYGSRPGTSTDVQLYLSGYHGYAKYGAINISETSAAAAAPASLVTPSPTPVSTAAPPTPPKKVIGSGAKSTLPKSTPAKPIPAKTPSRHSPPRAKSPAPSLPSPRATRHILDLTIRSPLPHPSRLVHVAPLLT